MIGTMYIEITAGWSHEERSPHDTLSRPQKEQDEENQMQKFVNTFHFN